MIDWTKLKQSNELKDRFFVTVRKCGGETTIQKMIDKYGLSRSQVIGLIKRNPNLMRRRGKDREKIFLREGEHIHYSKNGLSMYVKDQFTQCENVMQLIGTYMFKTKQYLDYVTFKLLYNKYQFQFSFKMSSNNFFASRLKVYTYLKSQNIDILR